MKFQAFCARSEPVKANKATGTKPLDAWFESAESGWRNVRSSTKLKVPYRYPRQILRSEGAGKMRKTPHGRAGGSDGWVARFLEWGRGGKGLGLGTWDSGQG